MADHSNIFSNGGQILRCFFSTVDVDPILVDIGEDELDISNIISIFFTNNGG